MLLNDDDNDDDDGDDGDKRHHDHFQLIFLAADGTKIESEANKETRDRSYKDFFSVKFAKAHF